MELNIRIDKQTSVNSINTQRNVKAFFEISATTASVRRILSYKAASQSTQTAIPSSEWELRKVQKPLETR